MDQKCSALEHAFPRPTSAAPHAPPPPDKRDMGDAAARSGGDTSEGPDGKEKRETIVAVRAAADPSRAAVLGGETRAQGLGQGDDYDHCNGDRLRPSEGIGERPAAPCSRRAPDKPPPQGKAPAPPPRHEAAGDGVGENQRNARKLLHFSRGHNAAQAQSFRGGGHLSGEEASLKESMERIDSLEVPLVFDSVVPDDGVGGGAGRARGANKGTPPPAWPPEGSLVRQLTQGRMQGEDQLQVAGCGCGGSDSDDAAMSTASRAIRRIVQTADVNSIEGDESECLAAASGVWPAAMDGATAGVVRDGAGVGHGAQAAAAAAGSRVDTEGEAEEWQAFYDDDGDVYFHHVATGTTQWYVLWVCRVWGVCRVCARSCLRDCMRT